MGQRGSGLPFDLLESGINMTSILHIQADEWRKALQLPSCKTEYDDFLHYPFRGCASHSLGLSGRQHDPNDEAEIQGR